jgi:predicted dehydrogenase
MEKVRWGIISTAKIALKYVIPAMQRGKFSEVTAIASRSKEKAGETAARLGIGRYYGSYEELLHDPRIDAVYNPLPNNMHMEWTIRALNAGKHVLCEKPLVMTVADAREMIRVRDRCGVKAGEAFMVKSNPQWIETRERVRRGEIGRLRLIQGTFSYYNAEPDNIRNIPELGGGGIWDIGCYPVTTSRYIFEQEPLGVFAVLEYDPEMKADRLGSVIMDFPSGQAQFAVSTQLVPYQRMHLFGTEGHLEIHIPFNAPDDRPCTVAYDRGSILLDEIRIRSFPVADQYTLMADAFSRAILEGTEVPVPLEDALNNTRVLTAIFKSAGTGRRIEVE